MKVLPKVSFLLACLCVLSGCTSRRAGPGRELIDQIDLKRGEIVTCGSPGQQLGTVDFAVTCGASVKADFNLAMELLHSFEYDEAEKAFAKVIDEDPGCAMAWWGVAMSNFHPLWTPPTEPELVKGSKAADVALSIDNKSEKETAYIDAIADFYRDWKNIDHRTRTLRYESDMEKMYGRWADDHEVAILYALALDAAADPSDKTYARQLKAGSILRSLYPSNPNHPGIIHYLIHTYDYPGLASQALSAARRYAQVAPSSAHALHMPSHIFTRLGLWDESIKSNLASMSAAQCYAASTNMKGHWDEELHGMDYLVYAYLQKGDDSAAYHQLKYLNTITELYAINFKEAYAFAAIPSRILLETRNWQAAAFLEFAPQNFPWGQFPWQSSLVHFTRLMGAVHLGQKEDAKSELEILHQLHDTLMQQKDAYKALQVQISMKSGEAWIDLKYGDQKHALSTMEEAAKLEDSTEKHPVTPGAVLPARELLGDMYMELKMYPEALKAYEATLQNCPNRFNSLYGAGLAAAKSGNNKLARNYFEKLVADTATNNSRGNEISVARSFLAKSI